jgi:uncharacterized membrane protein YhiD involved in acid resistance
LLDPKNAEIYLTIFFALISGLIIRITLGLTGQRWVKSYHQTLTYVVLPVTTLVVTKVIAGNIALSLGMIGALSIVRFRHPVKSPFELTMFFTLITIGIAMGVNYKWGILLTFIIVIIIILSKILENVSSNMGKKLFTISFDEGNEKIFLEINCKSKFKEIDESKFLVQVSKIDENNYFYRMVFDNKNQIDDFVKNSLRDEKNISYEIRYL